MSNPLTIRDVVALGTIVNMAIHTSRVTRLLDDPTKDVRDNLIVEGTARSIGDDRGYFARDTDDVRDCFLRVTTTSGFEAFWPVRELIEDIHKGYFVVTSS